MTTRPRPSPVERLECPNAVLHRSDVRQLGWEDRAVDAIFKQAATRGGVIRVPGYSRPVVLVWAYLEVLAEATVHDDRVSLR